MNNTMTEIQAKYLVLHDALGTRKDAKDKESFDQAHGQIWHECNARLQVRKAELEGLGVDTPELNDLRIMFPEPNPPIRNPLAEIDELKARIVELEGILIIRKS